MQYEELLTNVEFNQQVDGAKDAQEIVDLFAAKGVDIPLEIAQEVFEQPSDAELSADDLDDVAGGGKIGAAVGKITAYVVYRAIGKSESYAKSQAAKHAYYGYTKLRW